MAKRLRPSIRVISSVLAPLMLLTSCSLKDTPYALSLTDVDETGPQKPAVITISDPQVYARETLINDRRREIEFLQDLLEKSKTASFEPQLARDLSSVAAMRAELGLAFDQTALIKNEREDELDQLIFERDRLKLEQQVLIEQKRLEKMQTEDFEVTPRDENDTNDTNPINGPGAPGTPDSGSTLSSLRNYAQGLQSRLNSEAPKKSQINQSPSDDFRDREAYRAELRSALAAVNLDDLHDFSGNTLYRLQFDVVVAPGETKNKFGIADLTLRPPRLNAEQAQELYLRWIGAFANSVNQEVFDASGSADAERRLNIYEDVAQLLGLELSRPFGPNGKVLPTRPVSKFHLPSSAFVNVSSRAYDPAAGTPRERDAKFCLNILQSDDPSVAGPSAREVLTCATKYPASFLAGEGGDFILFFLSDLSQTIKDDPNPGSPYTLESFVGLETADIPAALRAAPFFADAQRRRDLHSACGIPRTNNFNTVLSRHVNLWGQELSDPTSTAIPEQFAFHAMLEDMAIAAIEIHNATRSVSSAIKGIGEQVDRAFIDEVNERAENYLFVLIQTAPDEKKKGCADHIGKQLSAVPTQFLTRLLADPNCNLNGESCALNGKVFAYGTTPVELANRTSTITSAARSLELALAATANFAQAGAAGDLDVAFMRSSSGNAEAIERTPIVVGYSDRRSTDFDEQVWYNEDTLPSFGWVFGPTPRINAEENEIVLEQVLKRHNVTADISIPAWWPKVELDYGSAWAANWNNGTLIDRDDDRRRANLIEVDLPMNESDLDMLTTHLANASLPGSGVEIAETRIDNVWPETVAACTGDITFLIEGSNVWRGTEIYLGGIRARNVTVLPDMKGIAATVNIGQLFSGWFSEYDYGDPDSGFGGPGTQASGGAYPDVSKPSVNKTFTMANRYLEGDAQSVDLVVWTRNGRAVSPIQLNAGQDGASTNCFQQGYLTAPRSE